MILLVRMTLNASYYVFDILTVDDVKIVTIIVCVNTLLRLRRHCNVSDEYEL